MPDHKLFRIAALLVGFFVLSSCRAYVPWVRVPDTESFFYIVYVATTRTIWLATPADTTVYRLKRPDNDVNFGKAERIPIPNNSYFTSMCASDSVWISSFIMSDPPPLSFKPITPAPSPTVSKSGASDPSAIYAYTNNAWLSQAVLDTTKNVTCKSLKDGSVVFWGLDIFTRFNSTNSQAQDVNINADWLIIDVADDPRGNLWVSTAMGEIYKQRQGGWVLVDTLGVNSHPELFVDNSGNLWVASDNTYIYKYPTSSSTPIREKVLESSSLGFSQKFFQDNSGAIWLIANNKLMVQKEGQFQEIDLPPYSSSLRFGFFDSETNALFVLTENGVFALDLDKYYAQNQKE